LPTIEAPAAGSQIRTKMMTFSGSSASESQKTRRTLSESRRQSSSPQPNTRSRPPTLSSARLRLCTVVVYLLRGVEARRQNERERVREKGGRRETRDRGTSTCVTAQLTPVQHVPDVRAPIPMRSLTRTTQWLSCGSTAFRRKGLPEHLNLLTLVTTLQYVSLTLEPAQDPADPRRVSPQRGGAPAQVRS
jgi:hypothetical protein